jgi:signal transduction histidine kinase
VSEVSLKTLIVDDDVSFRKLVELRLMSWNSAIDVTCAGTLREAREILDVEGAHYELVVLDQHLPDGLGPTLFEHEKLRDAAVLATSSDVSPELAGNAVAAGAHHFLNKRQISEPLFIPLVSALIERKKLENQLMQNQIQKSRIESIQTLLATLQHEINNPLGGVLGATYLIKVGGNALSPDQIEALKLIEQSGSRIKHVLQQLCETAELVEVTKGHEKVFHVPGDPEWKESK